jgi:hypothetical protein
LKFLSLNHCLLTKDYVLFSIQDIQALIYKILSTIIKNRCLIK